MITSSPVIEVGDEYEDVIDGSLISVTSVDVWQNEIGFTRRDPDTNYVNFEIMPEEDFITGILNNIFKHISSKPTDPKNCSHRWETYTGFSWTFKFCNRCNIKKVN